jgi:hypothetical protein
MISGVIRKQHYFLQLSRRVSRDLREFLEHSLGHLVDLSRIADALADIRCSKTEPFVRHGSGLSRRIHPVVRIISNRSARVRSEGTETRIR